MGDEVRDPAASADGPGGTGSGTGGPGSGPGGPGTGRGIVVLCLLAIVAGAATGFVGGAFRWCLERADELRIGALDWAHGLGPAGILVPVLGVALCAGLAALAVRFVPLAAGSGIQHVEAVQRGDAEAPPLRVLPAKFVGGLLAIGSGLVLGREGPTVHMGAVLGAETARRARRGDADRRTLQTAVAGAGLAVAFNAPLGGALFVIEEVAKSVRLRHVLPTLVAVAVAVGCSRLIIGDSPDFRVAELPALAFALLPAFLLFGALTGLLGVAYSRLTLGALDLVAAVRRVPPELKAAVIGALIGVVLFLAPLGAGGGDALAQLLLNGDQLALAAIAGLLVLRLAAGPLSYAAGTPGGVFAPLLALGALWGVLIERVAHPLLVPVAAAAGAGDADTARHLSVAFAICGMAALFGAVVRAPLTGVVIVIEMTAITAVSLPMIAATAAAVLVAQLLRQAPLYDSLRERMLGGPGFGGPGSSGPGLGAADRRD